MHTVEMTALLLPMFLAAVACFVWSFLSWTILPMHKADSDKLTPEQEARVVSAVSGLGLPKGIYAFPDCHGPNRNDPAFKERMKQGPIGTLSIFSMGSMGKNMLLTFLTFLAASFVIAYICSHTVLPSHDFLFVFQRTGAMGILAYTFAGLPHLIWFNGKPAALISCIIDGLILGLITGLIFAAMWPEPAVVNPIIG